MLLSEAIGRNVVSKESAATVGRISDVVVDPGTRHVVALVLKKAGGRGDTLPWDHLVAFGDDAVIIADEGAVGAPSGRIAELRDKRFALHGKRVLSTAGVELGDVGDIDFDPVSGEVVALVLKDTMVEGGRLVAVGSYAVIVEA